jgi:hypothetical protein
MHAIEAWGARADARAVGRRLARAFSQIGDLE